MIFDFGFSILDLAAALLLGGIDRTMEGDATYYRPGLMVETAERMGRSLDGFVSGVALNDCGQIGTVVWLEWGPGEFTGPHVSVDCAAAEDLAERIRLGRVVEVDAALARAVGFYGVGPRWVGVWTVRPVDRWTAN